MSSPNSDLPATEPEAADLASTAAASDAGCRIGSSAAIVDVQELVKIYRSGWLGRRRKVEALGGVTLGAHAGEVFGLLGPNGAGKTTLIKTLLGVIKPSRGKASLFGLPAGSREARRRVGYLPESLRFDPHHTARSALRLYGRLSEMDRSSIQRRSDELLELVGLTGRDRESIRRFSKGMCQRLGLAQALMHNPDLLILDEPTDGLDPVGRKEVRRVIERLRDDGKTIFLNSHILQEVELVCSRVAIMARGRIRGVGTIAELSVANDADEMIIEVAGDTAPEAIERAWASCRFDASSTPSDGRERPATRYRIERQRHRDTAQIVAPMLDQTQVNAAIDALRAELVSIVGLRTHGPSLEETFLRLVADDFTPHAPVVAAETDPLSADTLATSL